MKTNLWLKRGLDEIRQGHWFDGFQMLQGALQRTSRCDEPDHAKMIISKAVPLFVSGNQAKLACDLVLGLIKSISQKINERAYAELVPSIFADLRTSSLENCVQNICNRIIKEKVFLGSEFLSHLQDMILEANFNDNIVSDLYFCYAGLLCYKKDFTSCFETLYSWSQESPYLSPKMRTYLTLAEINAYEIEGCGKYLDIEDPGNLTEISIESETESYLEIANRIFGAVQILDNSEFQSTIANYSDLIDPKKDGLLKALCDGISEIFNSKSSSGLFSLFKS
ncbi:MAG: hypothetical protein ACXADY_08775 [Candidatus Hodarchaeales archaeon]|jgi:hypothetical protein